MHDQGVEIYLHAFEYGSRKPNAVLEQYCKKVYYYPRNRSIKDFFNIKPFIVKTRDNKKLLRNLLDNKAPILFEGIHTTFYLPHPALDDRIKIIRTHNIEQDYYRLLAKSESNKLKKIYFYTEALKLKNYEKIIISKANAVAAITTGDQKIVKKWNKNTECISSFHPFNKVMSLEGRGSYALFHGNLNVIENKIAAKFLSDKVFNDLNIPLIIAGKCSDEIKFKKKLEKNPNITLLTNLSDEKIKKLIQNAQLNVLYTTQPTGLKLKLIHAIFLGRYIIANNLMVQNNELGPICEIANDEKEIKTKVLDLFNKPFTNEEILKRENLLIEFGYMNDQNIQRLLQIIKMQSSTTE
mgnify:FL=1